jgi:hypothetical protein
VIATEIEKKAALDEGFDSVFLLQKELGQKNGPE